MSNTKTFSSKIGVLLAAAGSAVGLDSTYCHHHHLPGIAECYLEVIEVKRSYRS